ncbi:hypothetical protein FACS189434_13140 [Bacteroidia bacterium]|nr:hypothetical protein FACS189434_13140 [Bacteroidia bacterium]
MSLLVFLLTKKKGKNMAKEFLVEGALCMCKFGASPGKLKVTDNHSSGVTVIGKGASPGKLKVTDNTFFKANGGKLVATSQTLGNVFDPPGFGVCKVSPMSPKPCVPAITMWSGLFAGLKTSAGAQPLTDESKGTCGSGVPQCIEFMMTGQIPVPGMKNIQEATAEHQTDLDPMGEAAALTEHQIEFSISKMQ